MCMTWIYVSGLEAGDPSRGADVEVVESNLGGLQVLSWFIHFFLNFLFSLEMTSSRFLSGRAALSQVT